MTDESRRANVLAEVELSERAWGAALRIAAIGELEAAANRLYYAAYHMAMALCFTEGLEPRTHRGVGQLLRLHFIVRGLLPDWVEASLSALASERELVDYARQYTLSAERFEDRRRGAEKLIAEIKSLLVAGGWLTA